MSTKPEKQVISVPEGQIRDYVDGEFRKDTPEEYVRQTIEKRLINEHKYAREQIKIEFGVKIGSRRSRADIVVFPKDCLEMTQDYVWLIVECKKESIEPKNRKDGVEQLKSYMTACPNCEWGLWTNGKYKEVLRKVHVEGRLEFQEHNDIPAADGSLEDVDRPKRATLKKAYEDNLLMVFKTCHNHIYATDGLQKQPAFFELLKLIFCKTLDEQNVGRPLDFYARAGERANRDGQLTVAKRIANIFGRVKAQFPQIFEANDEIKLQPRSLAWIVSELQAYSLLETHVDVKGKAYEELVGANLRGDRGEFFTPRNIMRMAVEMVNPKAGEKVCDTSCGTGGFLVTAMNHIIEQLKRDITEDFGIGEVGWSDMQKTAVRDRIKEIAASDFYGFDINPDLVKATKMNMVMNNDGSGNIYRNDSLLPPHEWQEELKVELAAALNLQADDITNANSIGFFDVIVTNPPFGSKIPINDSHILEQFDVSRVWQKRGGAGWELSGRLKTSVPPEQLFIERCLQFLKPGGRLAIVLPDSILGNPGLGHIRHWLLEKTRIVASVDLDVDTFQPRNGTQTSVLILQKKTQEQLNEERYTRQIVPYNIFLAMVEKVGHDRRGNTLFKRDAEGNEIWMPEGRDARANYGHADEAANIQSERKTRLIDDQSLEVLPLFEQWKKEEGIAW